MVDEKEFILKGIQNVENFYKSFERKVRWNKILKEDGEVMVEMESYKKQAKWIFDDYEEIKDPTMEQLLSTEKRLFEFRNTIQRGHTYNQLLKTKYEADMAKRKRHIRELKEIENIEESKENNLSQDPEKLMRYCKKLERENRAHKEKSATQTEKLLDLKTQIHTVQTENEKLKKELDFEKIRREKDVEEANETQYLKLEEFIKKTLESEMGSFLKTVQNESTANSKDLKSITKAMGESGKITKQLGKDSNELMNITKKNMKGMFVQ